MRMIRRNARENQYQQEHHNSFIHSLIHSTIHSFIHSFIQPFASRKLYSHTHSTSIQTKHTQCKKGFIPFHSIRSFHPLILPSISKSDSPSSRFSSWRSRRPVEIARPGANGAFRNCHVLWMCLAGYNHPGDTVNYNKVDTGKGEREKEKEWRTHVNK